MSTIRELFTATPHRGAALHAADYDRAAHRVFRFRSHRRFHGVISYAVLPRMGEEHPDHPDLVAHASLPRRVEGGWEITVCYRPSDGKRRAA